MRRTSPSLAIALLVRSATTQDIPEPIVVPPSQYFEGNDGPWSTFDLRIGEPAQDIRVLVSTASPESLVPLADLACSDAVFSTVPSGCAVSRGNLYNPNESSTWIDGGTYEINQNGVGLEANLGYKQKAQFGLERMGIGFTGETLDNQTVASIATAEPFYLGIFGLNSQPVNFTSLSNYTAPSYLSTLKSQNKIPSLSWSYTAGAKYRLKQVYGQLVFGGYDASRFTENDVSFTMADDLTRDLVVGLQSISYSGESSSTLLSDSIDIYLDSTDPNLWLPAEVCDAFEDAFGISIDEESGLYLVNETLRNNLLDSKAEVTFRLSDIKDGGQTVSITLPYAAFDLTATVPVVDEESFYFPLKRANDSSQYTLGRTFLQEAYLSADYERQIFNLSACTWEEGVDEDVVTITSKDADSSGSGDDGGGNKASGSNGSSHLSGGTIAGIVIGSIAAAALIIGAVLIVLLRKRRKWMKAGYKVGAAPREISESILNGPVFNSNPQTSPDGSPMSPADVSGLSSSVERNTSSAVTSTTAPAVFSERTGGSSTPELDGADTHVTPSLEADSREVSYTGTSKVQPMMEVPEHSRVHELPGSEVGPGMKPRGALLGRSPLHMSNVPASEDPIKEVPEESPPPSPGVSTWVSDWADNGDSAMISPVTPTHPAKRRF